MEIKPGDKLLHITKYGGKNIIEVKSVYTRNADYYTGNTGLLYEIPSIKSVKGVCYDIDGSDGKFYKIRKLLSIEEVEEYDERQKEWKERRAKLFEQMRGEGNI